MRNFLTLFYKAVRLVYNIFRFKANYCFTWFLFLFNGVKFQNFETKGIPYVMIARGGKCSIGSDLKMNNYLLGNPIGRPQACVFFVDNHAVLEIGTNLGISSAAIIAHLHISIGDNVKLGGGVCIYDTDFHSLDKANRIDPLLDKKFTKRLPVVINNNAFIGAHSTILKGVTIGENSIIGACSVVTKSVPPNEVWGGNPAKFIKKLS